ncbi:ROK family transcriptional regulator [Kutzneria kofuensis]|uniref:Putative NBD/HSP70 family sugar kinase n=1 Tax=Kutzneria kofuensis TaxID=103725 RepID=A0A7W9KC10_9PSEU|nr:ROK family transcriptional regulator [Kutzneria kofuensis]MBB5889039.1 putative NBD/HSP70 family sugar kinase [Kutzneria kofuensis]
MSETAGVPVRQQGMRDHNLGVVLRCIADGDGVSRAEVAAATGLTKATVSSLVDELARHELIVEAGPAGNSVGRPGQALRLNPDGPVGIGIEINVDYLACCVLDLSGRPRHQAVTLADNRDRPVGEVLAEAAGLVDTALDCALAAGLPVAGVVAAVPGLVRTAEGLLASAPNLGWTQVRLVEELSRRGWPPVSVENEANLAALGELWFGEPPRTDFIHVSGEIGIGAGVIVGGELFRGRNGFAGELGHVTVHPDGPVCGCGARGCLEAIAGQEAILRAAGLPPRTGTTVATPAGPLARLVERAEAGDERAVDAVETAGEALGVALAGMVNLLDLDAVLLGGMFALLAPWLREPVEAELSTRVLGARWTEPRVVVSRLGWEAAVRGAAGSVVNRIVQNPAEHVRRSA